MATHKPRKVPKGFKVKMGRPKEWTLQEIDQLRVALDKWAKNPKNYYLSNFHIENDLHPEQMERFSNYSPAFAATLRKAKDAMTAHLVKMADVIVNAGEPDVKCADDRTLDLVSGSVVWHLQLEGHDHVG